MVGVIVVIPLGVSLGAVVVGFVGSSPFSLGVVVVPVARRAFVSVARRAFVVVVGVVVVVVVGVVVVVVLVVVVVVVGGM